MYSFARDDLYRSQSRSRGDRKQNRIVATAVFLDEQGRSTKAVEFLQQAGYTNALNLRGGILAWAERIDAGMAIY